jgi:hypothetical protein
MSTLLLSLWIYTAFSFVCSVLLLVMAGIRKNNETYLPKEILVFCCNPLFQVYGLVFGCILPMVSLKEIPPGWLAEWILLVGFLMLVISAPVLFGPCFLAPLALWACPILLVIELTAICLKKCFKGYFKTPA